MTRDTFYRHARQDDSRCIAELFQYSSDGVADYVWNTMAGRESLLDVGTARYRRENTEFSYQKCVVAERRGRVVGMVHAYPVIEAGGAVDDPVLRPYAELEAPGSLYLSGMALKPAFRNGGLGAGFFALARERARRQGLERLSALVFESNAGSLRLCRRQGFVVVDARPVVPHPLIRRQGQILLLTAAVSAVEDGAVPVLRPAHEEIHTRRAA